MFLFVSVFVCIFVTVSVSVFVSVFVSVLYLYLCLYSLMSDGYDVDDGVYNEEVYSAFIKISSQET